MGHPTKHPPEMTRRLRLRHRLLNLLDQVRRTLADLRRHRRLPRRRCIGIRCPVCGGVPTFSTRGWCLHCVARWPSWHEARAYGYPTRLEVHQGAVNECWDCGAGHGGHRHACGAVS